MAGDIDHRQRKEEKNIKAKTETEEPSSTDSLTFFHLPPSWIAHA